MSQESHLAEDEKEAKSAGKDTLAKNGTQKEYLKL
jgi:hypothetical protein